MIGVSHPLEAGFITSLGRAHRAGNITGVSNQIGDLGGKAFQLIKELRPGLSHMALFWTPDNPGSKLGAEAQFASARQHALAVQSIPINSREDLNAALAALAQNLPEALHVHPTPILLANLDAIVTFALRQRLRPYPTWL